MGGNSNSSDCITQLKKKGLTKTIPYEYELKDTLLKVDNISLNVDSGYGKTKRLLHDISFEEKDVVLGRIRASRGVKTQADLVLINFYQNVDLIRLGSYKEILIKTIYKSMAYTRNLAVLLHKSFPVDLIPEIFDTCWSFFKEYV